MTNRHTILRGTFHRGLNPRLIVLCALVAGNACAQTRPTTPTQIVAHYKIHKSGILIGTIEERFNREGDTYKIVSETKTAGALKWLLNDQLILSSEGKIGASGLVPGRYELKRLRDPKRDISSTFDFAKNRTFLTRPGGGMSENFALPVGTLDRVSAMYQFAFVPPVSSEVSFLMSQGKDAERYVYRKMGEPTIKVGETTYVTVHYVRETKPGESNAQLWLAKNRHYLAVRMIFEDSRGLSLEQTLVDLQTH